MEVPEISYETDDFADILGKDDRYDSRAYDFLLRVSSEASSRGGGHVDGQELLAVFRDLVLDAYGPMSYAVMCDWGLFSCEDVGEVVFNLCETGRMRRRETDTRADFIGGFNFKEEFLFPYEEQ